MKAKKSEINVKQPTNDQLELAFKLVAYSSLKENNESVDINNIEVEAARIERCVELYYRKDLHDLQYPEFASVFLQKNFKELVFGATYLDQYLGDLPEGKDEDHKLTDHRILLG